MGENVGTANWVDVTSDFSIPTKPTSGYGTFASAGKVSYQLSGQEGLGSL